MGTRSSPEAWNRGKTRAEARFRDLERSLLCPSHGQGAAPFPRRLTRLRHPCEGKHEHPHKVGWVPSSLPMVSRWLGRRCLALDQRESHERFLRHLHFGPPGGLGCGNGAVRLVLPDERAQRGVAAGRASALVEPLSCALGSVSPARLTGSSPSGSLASGRAPDTAACPTGRRAPRPLRPVPARPCTGGAILAPSQARGEPGPIESSRRSKRRFHEAQNRFLGAGGGQPRRASGAGSGARASRRVRRRRRPTGP